MSDLDEIPNLENIKFQDINNEILIFKQKMFYYKFNLHYQILLGLDLKLKKRKIFYLLNGCVT